jgi:hypothetical protein
MTAGVPLMLPANDNWPRGLRRANAARYLGISLSHFDSQRRAGAIPAPRQMLGVELYDRAELDALFLESADLIVSTTDDTSYWDSQCAASGNQNT